jgi:hypothetical protein
MSHSALKDAISLDVAVLGGFTSPSGLGFRFARRNGPTGTALHCPFLSLMRPNSTHIVNIEGNKIDNDNRGSLS